jgi:hypothetical protein
LDAPPKYSKSFIRIQAVITQTALWILTNFSNSNHVKKGKAVPLQAWSGPDGSSKLRFSDFMTMAQDGGKVVSLITGHLYPQETHLVLISVRG